MLPITVSSSSRDHITVSSSGTSRTILAVILSIAGAAVAILLVLIYICLRRKKRNPRKYHQSQVEADVEIDAIDDSLKLDLKSIKEATENFCDANRLGQGGSGTVYKGKLSNGQEVAIKKLFKTSLQKFKNEVPVAKLQHPNVVKLLYCCMERKERLLVYEYIPHCLNDFIFADQIKRADLDWAKRYKIIIGIARGLFYLHEESGQQTIHCDLKPSNILLDEEMNPKISDFGIAKWLKDDQTNKGNTENIIGTRGYMAPEYENDGRYSTKSDIYSFGILILEIICGRQNKVTEDGKEGQVLPTFARRNWKENTPLNIVDKAIESTIICSTRDEISRCIQIALLCVQKDEAVRPTMTYIVQMLEDWTMTLPVPSDPVLVITQTG